MDAPHFEDLPTQKLKVREVFSILLPFVSPHIWRLVLSLVLIFSTCAIELCYPVLLGRATDLLIFQDKGALSSLWPSRLPTFYHTCFLFLALLILKSLFEISQGYLIQKVGHHVSHSLRGHVFSKILSLPIPFFDTVPSGKLVSRIINDIRNINELFSASISVILLDSLIICSTLATMFWLHFKLTLFSLFFFPLIFYLIHHFGKQLSEVYRQSRMRLSGINAFMGENLSSLLTVQVLAAEEEQKAQFQELLEDHTKIQSKSVHLFALVQSYANALNGVAVASLLIYGAYAVNDHQISIGTIVAFLSYQRNIFQPLRDLVEKYNVFLSAYTSTERIAEMISLESSLPRFGKIEIVDKPAPSLAPTFEEKSSPALIYHEVSFFYPGKTEKVLDTLSFSLPPRRTLAIVGPTGSGKSTILSLLFRFYPATSGEIYFQGKALPQWDVFDLRRHFGVIH